MRRVEFQTGVNIIGIPEHIEHVLVDRKSKTKNGSNYNGKTVRYIEVIQNLKPCVK